MFSSQRRQGTYIFTIAREKAGVYGGSSIEWVVGYLDYQNYLLFSIGRDGFQSFIVQNGNKVKHGDLVPITNRKEYSIAVDVQSQQIETYMYDGGKWQRLQKWDKLLENPDRGQFGFKDKVTLYSFQFANRK